MALLLRKQSAQTALEGGTAEWNDNDYAVCDDRVIGRIYRIEGGPQHHQWRWALSNNGGIWDGIENGGTQPSLDAAKEKIEREYRNWLAVNIKARNPGEAIVNIEEIARAYGENHREAIAALRMIREKLELHGVLPSLEATGHTPAEEASVLIEAIDALARK